MKKLLILLALTLTLAGITGVGLPTEDPVDLEASTLADDVATEDVVTRRVYEGPAPNFWGTNASPDGRYVTQTDWTTGDLAVLDLLTGQQRRLTGKKDDGWVESYAYSEAAKFSPEGDRIAYVWYTEPGTYELRVVGADGTGPHTVLRAAMDAESQWIEWWPDLHGWSPDGRHLLATLWYAPSATTGTASKGEISLISAEDGSLEVLHTTHEDRDNRFASISRDGRFLAYDELASEGADPTDDVDVFVRPLSGGRPVRVVKGPSTDLVIGWTAEGDLLFYSNRELTEGVWRVGMTNGRAAGEPELLKGDLWGIQRVGLAGASLIYGIPTATPKVQVASIDMDRAGSLGPLTPIEPTLRRSRFPQWSPDGQKLLYWVSERQRMGQAVHRLMLRSLAGGETQDLTPTVIDAPARRPLWSPDSRKILLNGSRDGQEGRWAYDLENGTVETFPRPREMGIEFDIRGSRRALSHDWANLYYTGRDPADGITKLVRREIASGRERILTTFPGRDILSYPRAVEGLTPSFDDRHVALAMNEEDSPFTNAYVVISTADGHETRLWEQPFDPDRKYAFCSFAAQWTRDSKALLIQWPDAAATRDALSATPCQVYQVPLSGAEPVALGRLPENTFWDLHPDGRRLAVTTSRSRGEFWILETDR